MSHRDRRNARVARWLFMFALSTTIAIQAPAARAQVSTGNLNVHLGPPAGTTLISTTLRVASPSASTSSTVSEPGGTGPFAVNGLPVAADYTTSVTSNSSGGLVCTGSSAPFSIEANTTTILFVSLTCASPVPALSAGHAGVLAASLLLLAVFVLRRRAGRNRPGGRALCRGRDLLVSRRAVRQVTIEPLP